MNCHTLKRTRNFSATNNASRVEINRTDERRHGIRERLQRWFHNFLAEYKIIEKLKKERSVSSFWMYIYESLTSFFDNRFDTRRMGCGTWIVFFDWSGETNVSFVNVQSTLIKSILIIGELGRLRFFFFFLFKCMLQRKITKNVFFIYIFLKGKRAIKRETPY